MTPRLHTLLESAADGDLPTSAANAAIRGAQDRRRHRLALVVTVLVTAVLVIPLIWVTNGIGTKQSAPVSRVPATGLPSHIQGSRDLPELKDAPMQAASVAFISEGRVVVVNAATGESALIELNRRSAGSPDPGYLLSIYLSPNGTSAIVTYGGDYPPVLVDLVNDRLLALRGLAVKFSPLPTGPSHAQFAWAPDSTAFACACSTGSGKTSLKVFDLAALPDSTDWSMGDLRSQVTPVSVAWGLDGLAVRGTRSCLEAHCAPPWYFVPGYPEVDDAQTFVDLVDTSDQVALPQGSNGQGLHLASDSPPDGSGSRCWIGTNRSYQGSTMITPEATDRILVTQFENNWACEPASVGAARDGFIMIIDQQIVWVSLTGETQVVSTLPKSVYLASVASTLVGGSPG